MERQPPRKHSDQYHVRVPRKSEGEIRNLQQIVRRNEEVQLPSFQRRERQVPKTLIASLISIII